MLREIYPPLTYVKLRLRSVKLLQTKRRKMIKSYLAEGGAIQHFQIELKFWHWTTNKFDPFGESKNGFLILDLPDFSVERNVKSEIGFVTLVTFRQRVQYARQPLKKWHVFYCMTNYAIIPCRI